MCYRTGTNNVLLFAGASVRASFSPEILQAGAVKGLIMCDGRTIECCLLRLVYTDNVMVS